MISVEATHLVYSQLIMSMELTCSFASSEVSLVQLAKFVWGKAIQIRQQHTFLIFFLLLSFGLRLQFILGPVYIEPILFLKRLLLVEDQQFYLFLDLPIIDVLVIIGLFIDL